jgi:hypothetical protein
VWHDHAYERLSCYLLESDTRSTYTCDQTPSSEVYPRTRQDASPEESILEIDQCECPESIPAVYIDPSARAETSDRVIRCEANRARIVCESDSTSLCCIRLNTVSLSQSRPDRLDDSVDTHGSLVYLGQHERGSLAYRFARCIDPFPDFKLSTVAPLEIASSRSPFERGTIRSLSIDSEESEDISESSWGRRIGWKLSGIWEYRICPDSTDSEECDDRDEYGSALHRRV